MKCPESFWGFYGHLDGYLGSFPVLFLVQVSVWEWVAVVVTNITSSLQGQSFSFSLDDGYVGLISLRGNKIWSEFQSQVIIWHHLKEHFPDPLLHSFLSLHWFVPCVCWLLPVWECLCAWSLNLIDIFMFTVNLAMSRYLDDVQLNGFHWFRFQLFILQLHWNEHDGP